VPLTLALALATAFMLLALWRRWRMWGGTSDLEGALLVGALGLAGIGGVGSVLGVLGVFAAGPLAIVISLVGAVAWPWGRSLPARRASSLARSDSRYGWVAALVVLAAISTRTPVSVELPAGRDQGSYVLIADALVRTGGFTRSPAGLGRLTRLAQPTSHDVPFDATTPGGRLLDALVPRSDEPETRGVYEGRWRPGAYLIERDRARVTAQFMRLNTALLASAHLIGGRAGVSAHLLALSVLAALALFAAAARVLGSATWGGVATLMFLTVPAGAWTARLPLSEGPTLLLTSASVLAAALATYDEDPRLEHLAAFLIGMVAWTRGNGLLVAPVALVLLAVSAKHLHAKASLFTYAATVGAALLVHAWDAWPYLHDELNRLGLDLRRPEDLVAPYLAMMAVLVVIAASRAWLSTTRPRVADHAPPAASPLHIVILLAGGSLAITAAVWSFSPVTSPPFARLPLLARMVSPVLLVASACAILDVIRRARWVADVGPSKRIVLDQAPWLLVIVASAVLSAAIFAVPALPSDQLPYYGRYFVPEILPALAIAATHAFRTIAILASRRLRREGPRRRRTAGAIAFALVASALAYPAGPVFLSRDFRVGDQVALRTTADELANTLPREALVLVPQGMDLSRHAFNQIGGVLDFSHGATVLEIPRGMSTLDVLDGLDAAHALHAEYGPPEVVLLSPPAWLPTDRALHDPASAAVWPIEPPLGWSAERALRVEALVERVAPSRTFDWPRRARSRIAFVALVLRPLRAGAAEDPPLRATRRVLLDVDGTRLSDDFAPITTGVVALPAPNAAAAASPMIVHGSWARWDTPPGQVALTLDVTSSGARTVELVVGDDVIATTKLPASVKGRWTSPPLACAVSTTRWRERAALRDPAAWRVRLRDAQGDVAEPANVLRVVWWREAPPPRP
jgi:hypothetical protein